jgi:hypothetical protein
LTGAIGAITVAGPCGWDRSVPPGGVGYRTHFKTSCLIYSASGGSIPYCAPCRGCRLVTALLLHKRRPVESDPLPATKFRTHGEWERHLAVSTHSAPKLQAIQHSRAERQQKLPLDRTGWRQPHYALLKAAPLGMMSATSASLRLRAPFPPRTLTAETRAGHFGSARETLGFLSSI